MLWRGPTPSDSSCVMKLMLTVGFSTLWHKLDSTSQARPGQVSPPPPAKMERGVGTEGLGHLWHTFLGTSPPASIKLKLQRLWASVTHRDRNIKGNTSQGITDPREFFFGGGG